MSIKKKYGQSGLTILEAVIATAFVSIGFISILSLVNFSSSAIFISGERDKAAHLMAMVAEDLNLVADTNRAVNWNMTVRNISGNQDLLHAAAVTNFDRATVGSHAFTNVTQKWRNAFSGGVLRFPVNQQADIKRFRNFNLCFDTCTTGGLSFFNVITVNSNNGTTKVLYAPIFHASN